VNHHHRVLVLDTHQQLSGFCCGVSSPIAEMPVANTLKYVSGQNNSLGQFGSRIRIRSGLGVPIDATAIARYFKFTADQNHSAAQFSY
jgi:hypothetical protein